MAASLLNLSDLIDYELKRLNLNEFVYRDELQLQRLLAELDHNSQNAKQETVKEKQKKPPPKTVHRQNGKHLAKPIKSASQKLRACEIALMELSRAAGGGAMNGRTLESDDDDDELSTDFKSQVRGWLKQLIRETDLKSEEESRAVREAGNASYRKERHALKACDFFTEAIFLAPTKSVAAGVAHANRSTVLFDCGLYAESYDDCICALELGYPKEYHPIIKLRQASCALKLRNFNDCEERIHELLHMDLSDLFVGRTNEIWYECELMKSQKVDIGVQTSDDLAENGSKVYEVAWPDNTNNIITTTTNKGASLRTTTELTPNTTIFTETAAVFVTSGQSHICDNCASTQFIPFPCIYCTCRTAVYCSRKCRTEHASIHEHECMAHQIELFDEFSQDFSKPRLLQLALRMLTTGLPQVVPHCRKKPTAGKLWAAVNGVLNERSDMPYAAVLRMETYVDKHEDAESTVSFAVIALILAIYLGECTKFYDQLEKLMPPNVTKLARNEWQLLSASLLMRHISQLRHKNLVHCPSFVLPVDPHLLSPANEYKVWLSPKHLRKGYLHLIAGDVAPVAYAIFPHTLSLCRHSCVGALHQKFNGKQLTGFATTDLAAGANIYNCFSSNSGNYWQSLHYSRALELKAKGIQCKCEKCCRPYPDKDFHTFHRYRCDNPQCKQIFTPPPNLKYSRNLRWWNSNYYTNPENYGSEFLVCSICEEPQNLKWFWKFNASLPECESIEERCSMYNCLKQAEDLLVEMHECKVALARQLVEQCLRIHREGPVSLEQWEFNKLGSAMRSALSIVAAQYRAFSIEYVQHMSYFWDIMALSPYKCNEDELMQMLNALDFIPDEFKEIFINYYDEFIAPKFEDKTYAKLMNTEV